MPNSSDFDFVGLYAAILKDVAAYFPNDLVQWDRDLSRITRLSSSRGLPVFTMDLPALGKALDASLDSGLLAVDGLAHSGSRHPHSKVPRLFWGLWIKLFDDIGCLRSNIDPNAVFFLRTLLYVGKNLHMDCAIRYRLEAVKEWLDVEANLEPPSLIWEGDHDFSSHHNYGSLSDYHDRWPESFDLSSNRRPDREASVLDVVQHVADVISGEIGVIHPEHLRLRHGPGSVSDHSSREYKYDFRSWSRRLEAIFPFDEYGTIPSSALEVDPCVGFDQVEFTELASTMHAVPKTQKGPRLIASEPSCHQWIQQGIRDFLYAYTRDRKSTLSTCITFDDQEPSRRLALSASRSGRLATIDLKSASDRLSCGVVQRIFRRNPFFLEMLAASRTRFLRIPPRVDKKDVGLHKLRKFSTQGSALTFPIQSITFACVCIGVGKFLHPHESLRSLGRRVRVFGDDLIVPVEWEPLTEQILHLLGLRVNHAKTHTDGYFRESCGMDAFEGHDVTPAYVTCAANQTDPRSIASVVAVTNNFFRKGLWHASSWLESTITVSGLLTVSARSGSFGLISFSGAPVPATRRRWDKDLQKWMVRALQIFAKSRTVKQEAATSMLQFFTESRDGDSNWRDALYPRMNIEKGVPIAGVPIIRHTWVPEERIGLVS